MLDFKQTETALEDQSVVNDTPITRFDLFVIRTVQKFNIKNINIIHKSEHTDYLMGTENRAS